MFATRFDPYAAQIRLVLANRWAEAQARRTELIVHALIGSAIAGLLLILLVRQREAIAALVAWGVQHHAMTLGGLMLFALVLDQRAARRTHAQRLQRDWLAAQPVSPTVRRRRRRLVSITRAAGQGMVLLLGLWLAQLGWAGVAWLAAGVLAAALLASVLPDSLSSHLRPSARETPFAPRGRGSFWRWQWVEAGASLAPRRLAWALLAIVLVPRGAWLMAGVAMGLVALVTVGHAWQRALAVIPAAQRWIATQPVPASRWVRACLAMPLLVLAAATAALSLAALAVDSHLLALAIGLGLPAFGLLHLAVVIGNRRHPQRIAWHWPLHAVLLVSVIQSLALFAPLWWIAQLIWLLRRSGRT